MASNPERAPGEPTPAPANQNPPVPTARLRPHERLRTSSDFRRVFERKRAVSNTLFVVHAAENRRDHARIGTSVSRKIARLSVTRHRIKRLVREAFRLNKSQFQPGLDFVVVVRAPNLTYAQTEQSLIALARDAARRLKPTPPARENRPS